MLKNSDSLLLGLEIGGTRVRAALASGMNLTDQSVAVWPEGLSPVEEVDFVAEFALELAGRAGGGNPIAAAGVSAAALLNKSGAVVNWPNRPSWRGLELKYLLQRRLGARVVIEDDANSAALAEWKIGAARGFSNAIVLTVGTGIGAGLILNDKPHKGSRGWAGELGHVTVAPDGPDCPCGKRGCLQLFASGRALDRAAAARGLTDASAVVAAAQRQEAWAVEALQSCAGWLGVAIANAANLLDLDAAIVGGGLGQLGHPWWTKLEATCRDFLLNTEHRQFELRRAALGETAGLHGALLLAEQSASRSGATVKRMHG